MIDRERLPGSLRERRVLFTHLVIELFSWVQENHPAWELAFDEGRVLELRRMWSGGRKVEFTDAVHTRGSFHYLGLALDYVLYVDGHYISNGDHSAHVEIAKKWESLHRFATSGRRWNDSNHLSVGEGQKEGPLP